MSQDFLDDNELAEDVLLLEDEEIAGISEKLYIPLSTRPKLLKQIPLAFTISEDLPLVVVEGYTLAWTRTALAALAEIQLGSGGKVGAKFKNLPYASLRGFLEVGLDNLARMRSDLGINQFTLHTKSTNEPEPFAYLINNSKDEINQALAPLLNDWIVGFLKPFALSEKLLPELLERLEDLREQGDLLKISRFKSHILPWEWSPETGTTQSKDKYAYRMLADYTARLIAGQEIFQGLGPVKRVISSSGNFTSGIAELITAPYTLPGKKGTFSLIVRLEVVTYPSLHQPLLKMDVSKRRWLSQLSSPNFDRSMIRGFVFSQDYPDRAFSYGVSCKQDKGTRQDRSNQDKNKNWHWVTDTDFEILKRKLKLPLSISSGRQIASGKASTQCCQVVLTYRNGLGRNVEEGEDGSEEYGIAAGVPETDKLEAFEAISKILKPFGLHPFEAYSLVQSSDSSDDTASRMINLPTLLSAILEVSETKSTLEFTPQYLDRLNDSQLNSLLCKDFGFGLGDIDSGRKALKFTKPKSLSQTKELQELVEANQKALRRLYPNERPSLIVFYEDELQTEVKLLQAIIQILWGEALEVLVNRLPANTHGPRDELPGQALKDKERSLQRIEAWESTAQQIEARKQPTFCLVVARKFFPDPSGKKQAKRDDRVNKPSTRQALASRSGACVQLLEPLEKTQKTKQRFKLGRFFHRVQAALKDLLYAHSGRIDGLQEKVDQYLENIVPEKRPKEIIGITIVRKQKGRARGRIETTFLPIAIRLNVSTGECEMCCAYEKGNALAISPWNIFPDALAFISRISPVKLASKLEIAKPRFMEFVKQIISNSVEEGAQPIVLIDSSNCVQLWPWLADIRMNANQINLEPQYQWMEKEWQGARLIRIRQELAPGIIDQKVRQFIETSLEDTRSKDKLKQLSPDLEIASTSSSTGLFRLTVASETGCIAYLSVGRKTLHQYSRGQSCYRSTQINTPAKKADGSEDKVFNKAGLEVHQIGDRPPFSDQWPTPNPLEIVVTLRQPDDDPDRLAALVESLRYGFGHYSDWTALPGALFFERVVRDYISEFAIEDEQKEVVED